MLRVPKNYYSGSAPPPFATGMYGLNKKSYRESKLSSMAFRPPVFKNEVSGNADILLVPNVEAGNALVKMMIYFMGACAAGVVLGGKTPIVITSRSDEGEARLASIAAAIVSLN